MLSKLSQKIATDGALYHICIWSYIGENTITDAIVSFRNELCDRGSKFEIEYSSGSGSNRENKIILLSYFFCDQFWNMKTKNQPRIVNCGYIDINGVINWLLSMFFHTAWCIFLKLLMIITNKSKTVVLKLCVLEKELMKLKPKYLVWKRVYWFIVIVILFIHFSENIFERKPNPIKYCVF